LLRLLDRVAISLADVIVVDTREHEAMIPARRRADVAVVPIGASRSWFAVERRPVAQSPMKVLFFGIFTPLQGAEVIAEAIRLTAEEAPAITFTLIGTGQDYVAARRIVGDDHRVSWIDWVEPDELPAVAAEHDVVLGIFGEGDKATRVVPNKVVQGAAAGLAVVTADTAPQRALLGSSATYVPSGAATELAETLSTLAADPARVEHLAGRCHELIARQCTPLVVTEPLLALVR
jgi:glycosyltransferase involved in cell wall biosynthesis